MSALFEGSSAIPAAGTRSGYAFRAAAGGRTRSASGALLHFVDAGLDQLVETMFKWQRRLADRRALGSLDDRMLRDVGLTRADIYREASKPFWKP